jgi:hypothetical protein
VTGERARAVFVLLRSLARAAFVLPVRAYQLLVSPLLPRCCRFTPTCSEYAVEAIRRFGIVRGTAKGLWRIMRCHPLGGSGYDPVEPEPAGRGEPR